VTEFLTNRAYLPITFPTQWEACAIREAFTATAPPDLVRFTNTDEDGVADKDEDGVADKREVILSGWTLNDNAATLSRPFFGPDGWLYMCDGSALI
jgi:hypothetical protein